MAKKACKAGRARNPATGRCAKICKSGYLRYADLSKGRCRKVCRSYQTRDETTGRCRNKKY